MKRFAALANITCVLSIDAAKTWLIVDTDPGGRSAGVDPATAAEHFCRQPWVGAVYR